MWCKGDAALALAGQSAQGSPTRKHRRTAPSSTRSASKGRFSNSLSRLSATEAPKSSPPALPVDTSDRLAHLVRDAGKLLSRALQMRSAQYSIAYGHWTFLRTLEKGWNQPDGAEPIGGRNDALDIRCGSINRATRLHRSNAEARQSEEDLYLSKRTGRVLEHDLVPLAIEVNNIATSGPTKREIVDFRKYTDQHAREAR